MKDKTKTNVYEMITNKIIEELEKGIIPWEKPWTGVREGAFNRITKKPYSVVKSIAKRSLWLRLEVQPL